MISRSLIRTSKQAGTHRFLSLLLAVVYSLAIFYSASHFHDDHELTSPQVKSFSPPAISLYQQISLEEHAEHWHSDQHNCASCKLQSTTLTVNKLPVPTDFNAPAETQGYKACGHFNNLPTNHHPRAPPAFVV